MTVHVKVGGVWKTASAVYNKVGGAWKTASDMPVKVGGVWKTGTLVSSSFESIATFTGNGTASTYTFSSIPGTYKSLQLRVNGLVSTNSGAIRMRVNGDTGSNYAIHRIYADGATVTAAGGGGANAGVLFNIVGNTDPTYPTVGIVDFIDYASTSKNKTIKYIEAYSKNSTSGEEILLGSGVWLNTSAITSITVYSSTGTNFSSGASFALYGIKG